MNTSIIKFITNMSYNVFSNLIVLLVSVLVTLIIPKYIGVEDYGFWQLYLFYLTYIPILQLGWSQGIYLRNGGKEFNELDKELLNSQITLFLIISFFITILFCFSSFFIENENRRFIMLAVTSNIILLNFRTFLQLILQSTNRIKDEAIINIIDRLIFIILIFFQIFFGYKSYKSLIYSNLIAKFVTVIIAIVKCKDLFTLKFISISENISEAIRNINSGIKLLFSNLSSSLIVGVVRFGIERNWGVEIFGKISLTINISNFALIFINGIGLVIFPVLRRTDELKLKTLYITIKDLLMVLAFGILFFYYPFRLIVSIWLPEYSEAFSYMSIFLPLIIYEGKLALLINTYLKTLREEKMLMSITLFTLILSVVFTVFTSFLLKNLSYTVYIILFVQVIRSIISELYLSRILKINVLQDIFIELFITFIFILISVSIESWLFMIYYGIVYATYIYIKRKKLKNSLNKFVSLLKK